MKLLFSLKTTRESDSPPTPVPLPTPIPKHTHTFTHIHTVLKYSILIENSRYGKTNRQEMIAIESIVYDSQFLRRVARYASRGHVGRD